MLGQLLEKWLRGKGEGQRVVPGAVQVVPQVQADGFGFEGLEGALEVGEEELRAHGSGLVLDYDVRLERLTILRGKIAGEPLGEPGVQGLEFG